MKKQHLISLAILVAITAWMMVPRSGPGSADNPETAEREVQVVATGAPASENPDVISIRAERISPELYVEQIMVRAAPRRFVMFR